ncbi:MAG: hypothetical protein AB1295_06280 [Candidatus Micrarchaeota archaeon]
MAKKKANIAVKKAKDTPAKPQNAASKPKTQNPKPAKAASSAKSVLQLKASAAETPKPAPQNPEPKSGPVEITPEIRRLWIRMRQAWVVSYAAFNHSVSMLDDRQANLIYDVIKHSLFKDNHAQILREHPEMRPLLQTDDDRLCMHDIYERLSFRLNRHEEPPPDRRAYSGMKGTIGRNVPDLEV